MTVRCPQIIAIGLAWLFNFPAQVNAQEAVVTMSIPDGLSRLEIDSETHRAEIEVLLTNTGRSGQLTVTPRANSPYAPFSVSVCELNAPSGHCLAPDTIELVRHFGESEQAIILVRIEQNRRITNDNYDLQVWLRAIDSSGLVSLTEALPVDAYIDPIDHFNRLILVVMIFAGSVLSAILVVRRMHHWKRRLARGYARYYRD